MKGKKNTREATIISKVLIQNHEAILIKGKKMKKNIK